MTKQELIEKIEMWEKRIFNEEMSCCPDMEWLRKTRIKVNELKEQLEGGRWSE